VASSRLAVGRLLRHWACVGLAVAQHGIGIPGINGVWGTGRWIRSPWAAFTSQLSSPVPGSLTPWPNTPHSLLAHLAHLAHARAHAVGLHARTHACSLSNGVDARRRQSLRRVTRQHPLQVSGAINVWLRQPSSSASSLFQLPERCCCQMAPCNGLLGRPSGASHCSPASHRWPPSSASHHSSPACALERVVFAEVT